MFSDEAFSSFSLTPEDIVDLGQQGIKSTDELPEQSHAADALVLKLNGNHLTTVKKDSFAKMKSLKFLDISDNELTDIGEIGRLQSLVLLDLSKNRISRVDKLEKMRNLKRLLLARNSIQSVLLNSPVASLVLLDLRRNPLTTLDFGDMFPSVEELYIDKCLFSSLAGLEKFSSLLHLTASENKICDDGVISHPFVHDIDVSYNRLTTISPFYGMKALISLNVSSNLINNEGITMEGPMPNLRAFIASDIRITKASILCALFPNIEIVDLSKTDIDSLDDVIELITKSSVLRFLDLRGTPLTKEIYPPPKPRDQTIFPSIFDFDDQFPSQREARKAYRQALIQASSGTFEILDHVKIVDEEFMKSSPVCSAPASSSQGEYSDVMKYEEEEEMEIEFADAETEARPEILVQAVQVNIGLEAEIKKDEEIQVLKKNVTEKTTRIEELKKELTPFRESLEKRTEVEIQNDIGKPNCRLQCFDATELAPPRIVSLKESPREQVFSKDPVEHAMKSEHFECLCIGDAKKFTEDETQTAKEDVEIGGFCEFTCAVQVDLESSHEQTFEVMERDIGVCETQTEPVKMSIDSCSSVVVDAAATRAQDVQTEPIPPVIEEVVVEKLIEREKPPTSNVETQAGETTTSVEVQAVETPIFSIVLNETINFFSQRSETAIQSEPPSKTRYNGEFVTIDPREVHAAETQTEFRPDLVLQTENAIHIPLPPKHAVAIEQEAHTFETKPITVSETEIQADTLSGSRHMTDFHCELFELPQEDNEKLKRRIQLETLEFDNSSAQTEVTGGKLDISQPAKLYDARTLKHIVEKKVKENVRHHHHKETTQPIVIQAPTPQFPYEEHFSSLERHNKMVIDELQALRRSLKSERGGSQSNQNPQIDRLFVLVDSILNDNRELRRELEASRSAMASAQMQHMMDSMTFQSALSSSRKRRDSSSSSASKKKKEVKPVESKVKKAKPPPIESEDSTEVFEVEEESVPQKEDTGVTATSETPRKIAYPTHLNPHSTPVLSPFASRASMTDISLNQSSTKDRMNFGECEKSILVSARLETSAGHELQPSEPDFKIIHFWLSVSMRQNLNVRRITKLTNTHAFVRLQKKSSKLYLVLFPTDNPSERTKLPSPISVFRYLSRMPKPVPRSFLLCAANLGSQCVDNQTNKEPSAATERRLLEQGFDSLIYTHNGVESIRILDAKNVVPVFAVEL